MWAVYITCTLYNFVQTQSVALTLTIVGIFDDIIFGLSHTSADVKFSWCNSMHKPFIHIPEIKEFYTSLSEL